MSINGYGSPTTVSTLTAVLKEIYRDENYADVCYSNRPFFATLKKFEQFGGRDLPVPQRYTRPIGVSANFTNASGNATGSNFAGFVLTRKPIYGTVSITGEAIRADAANDAYTFVSYLKTEFDGVLEAVSDQISTLLYGSGTGAFGQVGTVSTSTITLFNINSVVNFEVGQVLQVAATDGASLRVGQETILKIDRIAGTLTSTDATWATGIAAIAAGDYIYVQGNENAVFVGLGAWCPATTPANNDSFFGVNRSSDPTRLAGSRFNAATTGLTVEEAIQNAAALLYRESAMADMLLMSPYDAVQLQKSQQSRVYYDRGKMSAMDGKGEVAKIGFDTIKLNTMGLTMEVLVDPKCPQGTAFMLRKDAAMLASIGKFPGILDEDGLMIARIPQYDAYQSRVGGYGQLAIMKTNSILNLTLPVGNALP